METFDIVIVGSGPSAYGAATALQDENITVAIISNGNLPNRTANQQAPQKIRCHLSSVDLKKDHAGGYAIYDVSKISPASLLKKVCFVPSKADGGFSKIWGAASVSNPREVTVAMTGFDLSEEIQSLQKVLGIRPADQIIKSSTTSPYSDLLSSFSTDENNVVGWKLRQASLMLKTNCIACGKCHFGCEFGAIGNFGALTNELVLNNPHFQKLDMEVIEFNEDSDGKVLITCEGEDKRIQQITASKLFLCAGVAGTTSIVMKSLNIKSTTFKDSPYFFGFVVGPKILENKIGLSRYFLRRTNPSSGFCEHIQLYEPSTFIRSVFEERFKWLKFVLPKIVRDEIFSRLWMFQGFLDSRVGWTIKVSLSSDNRIKAFPASKNEVRAVRRNTFETFSSVVSTLRHLSFFVIPGFLRLTSPGRGFHTVGTFSNGKGLQIEKEVLQHCDKLGRLVGRTENVFLLDATTFNFASAGPLTLTIVACAKRKAKEIMAISLNK